MKALVDTNAFIWMAGNVQRLSPTARAFLEDPAQTLYLSAVSSLEMAIKARDGRLDLPIDLAGFVATVRSTWSIRSLDVTERHAVLIRSMPRHHGDPFDRLLIAQAITEDLAIVTADRLFARYPVDIIW